MGVFHDHILRAKTLYMLFFEESTRTRNSFEAGVHQLGGHAHYLNPQGHPDRPRRNRERHHQGAGPLRRGHRHQKDL